MVYILHELSLFLSRVWNSRRIVLLSDKSKSEANVIALSVILYWRELADWTLGSRPSISGHPSIWAWFDNKHLTPASLLAFSLQPSKGPGSSNLDLHDFDHFSEVFCFICCPPGLTSTYLKIHQTLEMKSTFRNEKLDLISTANGRNAWQTSKEETNMPSWILEGRSSH